MGPEGEPRRVTSPELGKTIDWKSSPGDITSGSSEGALGRRDTEGELQSAADTHDECVFPANTQEFRRRLQLLRLSDVLPLEDLLTVPEGTEETVERLKTEVVRRIEADPVLRAVLRYQWTPESLLRGALEKREPHRVAFLTETGARALMLEVVGDGKFAKVRFVLCERYQAPLIGKLMKHGDREDSERENTVHRFGAEARFLRHLNGEGAPRIVEDGKVDRGLNGEEGDPYILMEHIPGVSLDRLMAVAFKDGKKKFPRDYVLRAGFEIADALGRVHCSLVHRDVKPENTIAADVGRMVLIDFGLAQLKEREETRYTASSATLGTGEYIAPEALGATWKATTAVDIYALGVILYKMATGEEHFFPESVVKRRFSSTVDQGAVLRQRGFEAEQVQSKLQGLSQADPELAVLLSELLHPDPEQRIDAEELQERLLHMIYGMRFSSVQEYRDAVQENPAVRALHFELPPVSEGHYPFLSRFGSLEEAPGKMYAAILSKYGSAEAAPELPSRETKKQGKKRLFVGITGIAAAAAFSLAALLHFAQRSGKEGDAPRGEPQKSNVTAPIPDLPKERVSVERSKRPPFSLAWSDKGALQQMIFSQGTAFEFSVDSAECLHWRSGEYSVRVVLLNEERLLKLLQLRSIQQLPEDLQENPWRYGFLYRREVSGGASTALFVGDSAIFDVHPDGSVSLYSNLVSLRNTLRPDCKDVDPFRTYFQKDTAEVLFRDFPLKGEVVGEVPEALPRTEAAKLKEGWKGVISGNLMTKKRWLDEARRGVKGLPK